MIEEICNKPCGRSYRTNHFNFISRVGSSISLDNSVTGAARARWSTLAMHPAMSQYIRSIGVAHAGGNGVLLLLDMMREQIENGICSRSTIPRRMDDVVAAVKGLSILRSDLPHIPERWTDLLIGGKMYPNSASARNKALWQKSYIESLSMK